MPEPELWGQPLVHQVMAEIAARRATDRAAEGQGEGPLSLSDLIHARAVERAHRERRAKRAADLASRSA